MNKSGLALLWFFSVVVSGFVGYQLGAQLGSPAESDANIEMTRAIDSRPEPLFEQESSNKGPTMSAQAPSPGSAQPPLQTEKLKDKSGETAEAVSQQQKGQRLEQLAEAFNQTQQQTLDHNELRESFEREFDEHDRDLEAQNHLTDFLQLHQDSHLIELHKIACSSEECQLLGQYDGDHEKWSDIVAQMQEQDWWQYKGTSSSSSSHDGVTYFNLFIDKGRGED